MMMDAENKNINELVLDISSFISHTDRIRIIITHIENGQLHCGISYKVDSEVHFLHLRWHFSLSNNIDKITDYFSICSTIHPIRQQVIAAKCKKIWSKNSDPQTIPYSIFYETGGFTDEGVLSLDEKENGLTCSTFVLAIFKSCGFNLIETTKWIKRDDDQTWHDKIIYYLEKTNASPEHLNNVRKEKGCSRFRPEEVAMSSTFTNMPARVQDIITRGLLLREIVIN